MRRVRTAALLVVAFASLAGCSAGPAGGDASVAPTPTPAGCPASTPIPDPGATPVAAGLTSVAPAAIPPEPDCETRREAVDPDPAFDYGFVVQITPTGFHPQQLVAACCAPIVWINLTNRPLSVVFDVEQGNSGLIPPGGQWRWTPPNTEAVAYHCGTLPAMSGGVQVNQTSE